MSRLVRLFWSGPDEALGALAWGAFGGIVALVAAGLIEAEAWTWGVLLDPLHGARGLFYVLASISIAGFLTRAIARAQSDE